MVVWAKTRIKHPLAAVDLVQQARCKDADMMRSGFSGMLNLHSS